MFGIAENINILLVNNIKIENGLIATEFGVR